MKKLLSNFKQTQNKRNSPCLRVTKLQQSQSSTWFIFQAANFVVKQYLQIESLVVFLWISMEFMEQLLNLAVAHMLYTILNNLQYVIGRIFYVVVLADFVTIFTSFLGYQNFYFFYCVNIVISSYTLFVLARIWRQGQLNNSRNSSQTKKRFTFGIIALTKLEILVLLMNVINQVYSFLELWDFVGPSEVLLIGHFKICILYILIWGQASEKEQDFGLLQIDNLQV
eukprot:TRINITY_DN866_c1_g1_i7.p2 TRINITY_DN866_c1_g1~~TRINITY_DN866_c1_g1_i7.p2  ORF type:complete len:226 (-),score=7.47 TRINITY_DN866_c1_g1_i7:766-1443(-)